MRWEAGLNDAMLGVAVLLFFGAVGSFVAGWRFSRRDHDEVPMSEWQRRLRDGGVLRRGDEDADAGRRGGL